MFRWSLTSGDVLNLMQVVGEEILTLDKRFKFTADIGHKCYICTFKKPAHNAPIN
jgi:hypothetical protein